MKMDKDTLIKQRFWVALCVSLPLVLIGIIWLSFVIPSSISEVRKKAESQLSATVNAAKDVKSKADVEDIRKAAESVKAQ